MPSLKAVFQTVWA